MKSFPAIDIKGARIYLDEGMIGTVLLRLTLKAVNPIKLEEKPLLCKAQIGERS